MAATIKERNTHTASGQSSNAFDINRHSTTQKRIATLRQLIFPLTKPSPDSQGNTLQLWSVPEAHVVGTLQRSDGSVRYIASGKIRNAINPEENIVSLHQRLLVASNCEWDYALMDNGSLTIWPHLSASGWRDALPKSSEDYRGLARLTRGRTQEQMCAWFYSNGYRRAESRGIPPQIEIHIGGALVGKLCSTNHEGIRNLLRQEGVIKVVHFAPSSEKELNFVGRGLVFTHPKDQTQTAFNIDFTRDDLGRPEEKGGYHIDVRSSRLQSKVQVSTQETYQANYLARKEGKIPYYKLLPEGLGGQQKALKPRSSGSPATQAFQQRVQQTRLTDSYNATHRQSPILPKGATGGSIGGVACSTAYIEGLFESPEALFEEEHFFCVPGLPDRKLPFSNAQLHQILRELAIGVYAHSTIPFFSLHFNDRADQYPVIHPVYENTLVGRVISMLDYIMKGYLNGGVFTEGFIDDWHNDPDWKKKDRLARVS